MLRRESEQAMDFENSDWIRLVKATREKFGDTIEEAHDRILSDEEMRRLVALRINRDPQCRKMAFQNLRREGENSRFVKEGDRLKFKRPDGQR